MENIDLIYSFFNQYMFIEARNNIGLIEHYVKTNPATSGNRLIEELVGAIKTYPFECIDIPLFSSIFRSLGKTDAESNMILGEIIKWKGYSKQQIAPAKNYLKQLCATELINLAKNSTDNSLDFIRYLRNANITVGEYQDFLVSTPFEQLDINSIQAELLTDGIESCFDWLNASYEPTHKVPKGQIIMIVAPPGVGKTLFCMNEALYMASCGHKVHYLAMGDMRQGDFIQRMSAIHSGLSFGEATSNINAIFSSLSQLIGETFTTCIVPSDKIDVDDYIEEMLKSDYEVCFIDYDSNFNQDKLAKDDSMFKYYGK